MSRSSTASASKQLPTKSAWARGPPQPANAPSSRSQSPAPSNVPPHVQTHQRRSSQLSQGVGIKDGVSIPRGDALKQGSGVTFGTIRDAPAPISSSPVAAPAVAAAGSVKTFGSVLVNGDTKPTASAASTSSSSRISSTPTASTSVASSTTPSASSTKSAFKMDVAKLFQGSGSSSTPSAPSTSETQSPSARSSNLPPQSSHQPPPQQHQGQSSQSGQPSQMGGHHFTPFVPGMRQQNGGPGGPGGVPRSPSYNRNMTNGNSSRPTGPNGPNGPSPIPPSMSSPRLQSHPHAGQPTPMAPPPQMQWPPYTYYPPYDYGYMYMPQQMPPPPNSLGPPQPGMAMSPRTGPIPLQSPTPGTPTPPHAVPHIPHVPHPPALSHTSSSSISGTPSTPTTPSTGNIPLSAARLNMGAPSFVPGSGRGAKISIKNPNDGAEIKIENWKKGSPGPGPSPASSTPPPTTFNSPGSRQPIRLESEDARKKRIAEEEEKQRKAKEAEQAKREAEETAKREKERKEKEEKERKEKEEDERRKKEEEKEKELKRLEEEKIRKEQEERERKQKEEKEKEEERLRLEEAERVRKLEEAERKRKEEEDQARLLKEKEAKERAERETEEKAKAQAEAEEKAKVEAAAKQAIVEEPEEGEVIEADAPVLNGIPKPREKEGLRIDTADSGRKRPGPLNLTIAKGVPISAAPMSALATARRIEDLGSVQYPDGIRSPSTELNANAQDSKFRYDRDFLLQFMKICTEKPDMLPPLDAIGLQPSDQSSYSMTRGGSGRHRQSSGAVPASRQASTGLNFNQPSGFNKASPVNTFTMGQFATPGAAKMSSEDRFAMSSRSASGPAGMAFGRPAQMQRTASQGGPGPMNKQRTRSKRGEDRGGNKANSGSQHSHGSNYNSGAMSQSSLGLEPVAPLQQSANRWDRKSLAADPDSPEIVDRKVKGLLNKLTMEKFDSISDQIIEWANRSEKEKDGRTLIQVIRLVFEKATDEATWSEMYARLCRKMMEQISPKVQDDGIKNAEGKPITGGHLFRKYLLNRCQEDFERGWVAKEATAAAAASKALEDKAAKAANDKAKENAKEGESTDEVALYSEEYYAAQKAKRQGLGLIKFIGELFKLQMLTERIMHECVKKLLGNVDNPEEEEIESLCKLLSTVGQLLDTPKARAHMDVYFSRMKDLIKSPNISSRMRFMLQDVIELRERRWVSRHQATTSLTAYETESSPPKSSRPLSYKGSATLFQSGMPDGRRRRLEKVIDVDEFFNVRNLDEAEVYLSGLPSLWHRERVVETLVSKAIESKEADANLVADFFTRAASKGLCSPTSFEEGFLGIAESLGEIAIDAPKAWDFMALMVKGAHLDGDSRGRIASKTADAARLLRLLPSQKAIVDLSPFKTVPDGQLRPLGLCPSRVSPPGYHEAPSPLRPYIPTSPSNDDNCAASSVSHSPLLAAARFIVDLGSIQHPDSIQGPNMKLNINTPDGKFRYDREFLLQFMKICTYRPDSLPPLDAIGLQSFHQTLYSEPMTWRGSFQNQTSDAFRPISGSVGQGFRKKSGLGNYGPANVFTITLAGTKTSSDNKIQGNRVYAGSQGISDYNSSTSARSSVGLDVVTPLQQSANSWDRKGSDPTERKVRGLLNKLTEKTFDSVSSQIIVWADKLHDGHDHRRIIRMICEALDDRMWLTRLLAGMCEKMQGSMFSARSQDFREGLFQQCMAGFKQHWESKDGTAKDDDPKAKRQALGLLSFMGQPFVLQMLGTGDAICLRVETLLGGDRKLEGLCTLLSTAGQMLDDHRSCQLLRRIDAYFSMIEELCHHPSISPRISFMLQDVVMMRESQIEELSDIYAYDRAFIEQEFRRMMDDSDSDEEVTIPASDSVKPRVPRSDKPNIDPSRARTPQEEAWRLKLLQELLDEVEEHEERGTMNEEEATKKILDDADELFVTRDVAAAEAYFSGLPTMYHQRLVKQLVSRAIELESDEVSAVMVAHLFDRVASKKLCSPLAFEEGFRGFARSLEDIAIDVPKAWWFMDIMVDGVCWNEGYQRQRIVPYQMQKYYLRRESSF